jgi:hypothetical protein
MSEQVETAEQAADEANEGRLRVQGAALRLDTLSEAQAFVSQMGEVSAERLAQACLERCRLLPLVIRIGQALRNRPELLQALVDV